MVQEIWKTRFNSDCLYSAFLVWHNQGGERSDKFQINALDCALPRLCSKPFTTKDQRVSDWGGAKPFRGGTPITPKSVKMQWERNVIAQEIVIHTVKENRRDTVAFNLKIKLSDI